MSARLELALGIPAEDLPLEAEALHSQVLAALAAADFDGALSLAVVDDAAMRLVNRDYHGCDAPTDVLAFPLEPAGEIGFDGEVIVSWDTARREALERGVEPVAELLLYVVHGVLHLLGEDDHDPDAARRMHARTLEILAGLGHYNVVEAAADREAESD